MRSAAAARTAGPASVIVLLADFSPVFGVTSVSCRTKTIWLRSMSSSSAAIINNPVADPCPSSTRPDLIDAVLSALIAIHESTWFGSYGPLLANGFTAPLG